MKRYTFLALSIIGSVQAGINGLHPYIMANFYQFGGNVPKAHAWYNRLVHDAMPPYAYEGYIEFLHTLGHNNHIYALLPKVDSLFPYNPKIQLIFAQVLESAGKEEESYQRILSLATRLPANEEISYAAAQIFIKRHEPKNAIATIDTLLNGSPRKPNTFIFHYSKAVAQLSMSDAKGALETVKKSLELQPRFDRGWLLYSLIEEQLGNSSEALRGYATYQKLSGNNDLVDRHVRNLKNYKNLRSKTRPTDQTMAEEIKALLELATHRQALLEQADFTHNGSLKEFLTSFAETCDAAIFHS